MCPRSPQRYVLDHGAGYAKPGSQNAPGGPLRSQQANFPDLDLSEFRRPHRFPFRGVSALQLSVIEALPHKVPHVAFLRSQEEMVRIDTQLNVAGVQHIKAGRNISLKQPPGHSVCSLKVVVSYSEHPITAVVLRSRPQPTGQGLVDFCHKALYNCFHDVYNRRSSHLGQYHATT